MGRILTAPSKSAILIHHFPRKPPALAAPDLCRWPMARYVCASFACLPRLATALDDGYACCRFRPCHVFALAGVIFSRGLPVSFEDSPALHGDRNLSFAPTSSQFAVVEPTRQITPIDPTTLCPCRHRFLLSPMPRSRPPCTHGLNRSDDPFFFFFVADALPSRLDFFGMRGTPASGRMT